MCIKIQQTTARLLCICSLGSIIETGIIIAIIIPNISMELSSPAPDANEEIHAIMQFIAQKKKHIPIAILFRNFFIQLFSPQKSQAKLLVNPFLLLFRQLAEKPAVIVRTVLTIAVFFTFAMLAVYSERLLTTSEIYCVATPTTVPLFPNPVKEFQTSCDC